LKIRRLDVTAISFDAPAWHARAGWRLAGLAAGLVVVGLTLAYADIGWLAPPPPASTGNERAQAFPWARAGGAVEGAVASEVSDEAAGVAGRRVVPATEQPKAASGRPDDLTADEWATLQAATQGLADGERQLAAMADFMRFQKAFVRWEALHAPADQHARRELGHQLLDQVVGMAASGVVTTPQAQQIQDALIADLEPDPPRREALQREQLGRLPQQVPAAPDLWRPGLFGPRPAERQRVGQAAPAPV
jgi:hypothetical protein